MVIPVSPNAAFGARSMAHIDSGELSNPDTARSRSKFPLVFSKTKQIIKLPVRKPGGPAEATNLAAEVLELPSKPSFPIKIKVGLYGLYQYIFALQFVSSNSKPGISRIWMITQVLEYSESYLSFSSFLVETFFF